MLTDEPIAFEWTIPSSYGYEKMMMQEVASFIHRRYPQEKRSEDMTTAIAEACLNAIEHGNRLNPNLSVTLQMTVDSEKYRFRILDNGDHVPKIPRELTLPHKWSADPPRGWGLYMMRKLADQVEFGMAEDQVYLDIIFLKEEDV